MNAHESSLGGCPALAARSGVYARTGTGLMRPDASGAGGGCI